MLTLRALAAALRRRATSAVGATMRINGEPYTIVGVLPADFTFLDPEIKLWMPLSFTRGENDRTTRGTATTGR